MLPSVDRVASVPVVPVVPVVPAPVVASDGRWVVEFMLPGIVPSRDVVLGVWPCNWPGVCPWFWFGYGEVELGVLGVVV